MKRNNVEKLLNSSRKFTFYIDGGEPKVKEEEVIFKYRGQDGWSGISQKICVTDTMSMGISIIQPEGAMQGIPTAHEFVDFLLFNDGYVTIDGIGEIKVEEGDFLNFKEKVVRSSGNVKDDIVIGIWFQKAMPSYQFD